MLLSLEGKVAKPFRLLSDHIYPTAFMNELVQVKTKKKFAEQGDTEQSKLVIDQFIQSCLSLDAGIFEPFIQENEVFQEQNKYEFLADLKRSFDLTRKRANDSFTVELSNDTCRACFIGHRVHVFTTYNSAGEMIERNGFVIQEIDDILIDISRCYYYKDLPPDVDPKFWESRIGTGYTK